ncbi:hypothetical protein KDA11_01720, partial [Candidatus Saccharibacteria bacterium]|nr:hypothetical protein [Candidatus Saccharibacteria bacterium]
MLFNFLTRYPHPYNKIGDGPEGPEVKTMACELAKQLSGSRIVAFRILNRKYLSHFVNHAEFQRAVNNHSITISTTGIRGKWLWIQFSNRMVLANHLRMTGQWAQTRSAHSILEFQLSSGKHIYYDDYRRFSYMYYWTRDQLSRTLDELAPDILNDCITEREFVSRLHRYPKGAIYPLLLKQNKVLSGVGNYIVNEALYRARISPRRKTGALTTSEEGKLYRALTRISQQSFADGGCSAQNYTNIR